jgi:hypothetical protein
MSSTLVLVAIVSVFVAVGVLLLLAAWLRVTATRVVTCPANHQLVSVRVAGFPALLHRWFGPRARAEEVTLASCSRFQGKPRCDQRCVTQIEAAPDGCLLWPMVERWYHGKACARCAKVFTTISHGDQRPGLLDPSGRSRDWNDVPIDQLEQVFATHRPVCWDCHVVEQLYLRHPELVVERDPKWGAMPAAEPAAVGDVAN